MTSSTIAERARITVLRLSAATALHLFVECTPVPAPRPRVMKNGTVFYPAPYPQFMGVLQKEISKLVTVAPFEGPLVVAVEIVRPRPKTTKLHAPRGDVDNLAKGPLDAATKTGRLWGDDVQIVDMIVSKRWSLPGEPSGVHMIVNTLMEEPTP